MSSVSLSRWCGSAAQILVLAFVFLVLFGGTALVLAFFLSWIQGAPFGIGANWYIGMICGLIAWMFVAVFHFRKESIQLPVNDREAFGQQVRAVLGDLGYDLAKDSPEQMQFRPAFQSHLLGGGVNVSIEGQQAKISGPKVSMEVVRNRMRFQNHLKKVAIEERKPQAERIVKRVQLSFRVPHERWQEVGEEVVKRLAGAGDVVCQVNLSVQNEKGLSDTAVEGQVRQWLEQQGMAADIHKTHG